METEDQWHALRELDCAQAQGYLFAAERRPVRGFPSGVGRGVDRPDPVQAGAPVAESLDRAVIA